MWSWIYNEYMKLWKYVNSCTFVVPIFQLWFHWDMFLNFFLFLFYKKEILLTKIKGNAQFFQNATFGLWEKMKAQLQKCFVKCQPTLMRLSPLCYFANLFTLKSCLILRGDQKMLSIWIFFCSHSSCMIVSDFYIIISCGIG